MSERIELHLAFVWDCPACGREQFERGVQQQDPDVLQEFYDDNEITDDVAGEYSWYTHPLAVVCRACGARYDVEVDGPDYGGMLD